MKTQCDVAIVGGGPAGSTVGALLKKYRPDLKVNIYEREVFPRDHVGESQLPLIGPILDEMGVWEKVEAANFPIKIGATYRWGASDDLWDFEFYPGDEFVDEPRPAEFRGQRRETAFQVDRAVYDEILLNHAEELGCKVFQGTKVKSAPVKDGAIEKLVLESGEEIHAKYYLDGSGHIGFLRRALGVASHEPSNLQNVAFWDYWQNAEWAVEIGVGATRVQVMSLGWGWLWFIPLGPTRTSIGLVCPAQHYKKTGLKPEELYLKAIEEEPNISKLVKKAEREMKFEGTKDWSFTAEKMVGPNWMLIGESAGFADPVLAAGLTLAHSSAREAAYSILEAESGAKEKEWLFNTYEEVQTMRINQHIRFADFWYTANGKFTDLKEYTREIAKDSGMEMNAEEAFRWLGTGGFADGGFGLSGTAGFSLFSVKAMGQWLMGEDSQLELVKNNIFRLNIGGAERRNLPVYESGTVNEREALQRRDKTLPLNPINRTLLQILKVETKIPRIMDKIQKAAAQTGIHRQRNLHMLLEALEAMVADGWVKASNNKKQAGYDFSFLEESNIIHSNVDTEDHHSDSVSS